jgi:3'-phosphoadenosine 5'-phosphosulfate (PAPS) 3'-phosphatase
MPDLDSIHDVLFSAVLAGAAEVLAVKRAGQLGARLKFGRELVTEADRRSDAAILSVFQSRLPRIDPSISFHLEESGVRGSLSGRIAGADPLDGTNHFACGGNLYAVQAHFVDDGLPLIGVILQPEVFLPLEESPNCMGRIVTAIRGRGAFSQRTEFESSGFKLGERRPVVRKPPAAIDAFVACVPYGTKMNEQERALARKVHDSGLIASTTGAGSAAANVMMTVFGGQHLYANFGAGEDLDLIPPQVIAIEAGLTVWGIDRKQPVWNVRKQPFIAAPDERSAELFFRAAGL